MAGGRPTLYDPAYCEVVVDTMREGKSPKRIPISAANRIAAQYGYDQIVIYARKVGEYGCEHMTTYGTTKKHCGVASQMGEVLKNFMGWNV